MNADSFIIKIKIDFICSFTVRRNFIKNYNHPQIIYAIEDSSYNGNNQLILKQAKEIILLKKEIFLYFVRNDL